MKKKIKVCLIGAKGKLASSVSSLLYDHTELMLAFSLVRSSSLKEREYAYAHSDIILDLSSIESLSKHIKLATTFTKPFITGITGLLDEHYTLLKKASNNIPIFYSTNFSTGIALLNKILKQLPQENSYQIIEKHHQWKKDSPSGTALNLKKSLPHDTPISSIREGDVIGEHAIIMKTPYETLTLTHTALNRSSFASGVVDALIYLVQKTSGYYTSTYDQFK